MKFQWNKTKAALNVRDHGVSFKEAGAVFDDPLTMSLSIPDEILHTTRMSAAKLIREPATYHTLVCHFLPI